MRRPRHRGTGPHRGRAAPRPARGARGSGGGRRGVAHAARALPRPAPVGRADARRTGQRQRVGAPDRRHTGPGARPAADGRLLPAPGAGQPPHRPRPARGRGAHRGGAGYAHPGHARDAGSRGRPAACRRVRRPGSHGAAGRPAARLGPAGQAPLPQPGLVRRQGRPAGAPALQRLCHGHLERHGRRHRRRGGAGPALHGDRQRAPVPLRRTAHRGAPGARRAHRRPPRGHRPRDPRHRDPAARLPGTAAEGGVCSRAPRSRSTPTPPTPPKPRWWCGCAKRPCRCGPSASA
jgi:hypothetical protein